MVAGPVLITGAAGFIGSNLADSLLADGVPVVCLDNFCDFYDPARKRGNIAAARRDPKYTLVEADIRNRLAVREAFERHRPESVIHLAAMAGVRPSIENPALYTAVNLDGTVHLLDAAVATGVKKFVFASSSSVYGNNAKVPFAESDNVDHPISPYAATKKAGELICHTYAHLHGLPITCLRFFTVFGPRQRPDLAIAKFLALAAAGRKIPMFGDGSTSRDYTFIADIVAGIRAALARCGRTPADRYAIYNLGGNEPVSLRQMIATINEVVGRPLNIETLPMQPGDVERTWADLTHSRADLGYQPQTRFVDGVRRQWQWMQEQGLA
jgi:UDP-glucuronate 4-epimerase